MKYFNDTSSLEKAKKTYRTLAKKLHPDKGGDLLEFQIMQKEYKEVLLKLRKASKSTKQQEILTELGILAGILIKNKVPQAFFRSRIDKSKTNLEKNIYNGLISLIDEI